MDNVKCAILKRHTEGLLVEIQLGFRGINPTKTNMELLKRWYKKHTKLPIKNVSDITYLIVPAHILRGTDPENIPKHPPMTIRINYRLHDTRRSQVDVANLFVVNPTDSNSRIYVKNGKITSIDTQKPNEGEATRVICKIVASRITTLNNSNNFGKNFGSGMMGNGTPFQTR